MAKKTDTMKRMEALEEERDRLIYLSKSKIMEYNGRNDFIMKYQNGYFRAQKKISEINKSLNSGKLSPDEEKRCNSELLVYETIVKKVDRQLEDGRKDAVLPYLSELHAVEDEMKGILEQYKKDLEIYNCQKKIEEENRKAAEEKKKAERKAAEEKKKAEEERLFKKAAKERLSMVPEKVNFLCLEFLDEDVDEKVKYCFRHIVTQYLEKGACERSVSEKIKYERMVENACDIFYHNDFIRWIQFCNDTLNKEWSTSMLHKPEWLDDNYDNVIMGVYGKRYSSDNIMRLHNSIENPNSWSDRYEKYKHYNTIYTGMSGAYARCFDIDPDYKDTESALYMREVEDAIREFGSIGCQKLQ